jgi:hypothetical protein
MGGLGLSLVSCTNEVSRVDNTEREIKGYGDGDIVISVFWPPSKGFTTDIQYDYLVEAGIDLLEWGSDPTIFTDEHTVQEALRLCNERGLKITICDSALAANIVGKSEGEIVELVNRYKDNKSVVGYFLGDEPANANPYGRIARIMSREHPGCIVQLNLLPTFALEDPRGHVEDWINAAGVDNLRYLSYDQYPFGLEEGSIPQMFPNMDFIREIGLKYGVDTALYIQSVGVVNGFRRPTVSETRYHTSAALAYGYKNLKYFTWLTPVDRGEEFTNAIISPEGEKTDTFEGIAKINRDIKKVSKILGHLDAVEIYHNGRVDMGTTMLEPGWYLESTDNSDFLVSLMVDRDNGTNYFMVVNKNFKDDVKLTLKLNGIKRLTDVTSGSDKKVRISRGKFKCEMVSGGFRLYRIDDNVSLQKPYEDDSDTNLALGKPVYSTSSIGENGYYNYKVVDGQRKSSKMSIGWRYVGSNDEEIFITVDLKREIDINRVDLYPVTGSLGMNGAFFPRKYTIMYSLDGKDYEEIVEDTYDSDKPLSYKFDTIKARYVKIRVDEAVNFSNIYYAEIGEIEIYNDDGTIPEYQY